MSTFISYIYFPNYFLGNCDGLLLCAVNSFILAMKNSGIGYSMYGNDPYAGNLDMGNFFFQNLFNIIIMIIIFNILTGIIINSFMELRELDKASYEDKKNKCFICGVDKDTLKKTTGKTFRYHKKYVHNKWFYIFFIFYLQSKNPDDFSGIESFISREIKKEGISWIPQEDEYLALI